MRFSKQVRVREYCKSCGKAVRLQIWEFVDVEEFPDIRGALEACSIHHYNCPKCKSVIKLDKSFVVIQPSKQPNVIFVPATDTRHESDQEDFSRLILKLDKAFPEWRQHWSLTVRPLPSVMVTLDGNIYIPEIFWKTYQQISGLQNSYGQTGQLNALNQVVMSWHSILTSREIKKESEKFKHFVASRLAHAFAQRYKRTGNIQDMENGIALSRDILPVIFENHPEKGMLINTLSSLLNDRFNRFSNIDDLYEAVDLARQALLLYPKKHPERFMMLGNLANRLGVLYEQSHSEDVLEEAFIIALEANEEIPDTHPDKPLTLNTLGNVYNDRFRHFGNIKDWEESAAVYKKAIELVPDGYPTKALLLNNLAQHLIANFVRFGDKEEQLDSAVEILKQATSLIPDDHGEKPKLLSHLADMLEKRFIMYGAIEDIDAATDAIETAIALTPKISYAEQARYLNILAGIISNRPAHFEDLNSLDQAIETAQRAVDLAPLDNLESKANYLNTLAEKLADRFERLGKPDDLERGVESIKTAISLVSGDQKISMARYQNTLANLLRDRYYRQGSLEDLEQALEAAQKSSELTGKENQFEKARHAHTLALTHYARYRRMGELSDLELAISAIEKSVEVTPDSHHHKPGRLNNLANMLGDRFSNFGRQSDLTASIAALQQALSLLADEHPQKIHTLINLSLKLQSRFFLLGNSSDIESAINFGKLALQKIPPDHPLKAAALTNLSTILLNSPNNQDKFLAKEYAMQALNHSENCSKSDQVISIRNALQFLLLDERWLEAEIIADEGMTIIDDLVKAQLSRREKASWLREGQILVGQRCYIKAKLGKIEEAVIAVESRRATLLSEALERNRRDLEKLKELGQKDLLLSYYEISAQIAQTQKHKGISWRENIAKMNVKLNEVIGQIKSVTGFEDFLIAPDLNDLTKAASYNTLVYLLTTNHGGVILIVTADGVQDPIWLPDLSDRILNSWMVRYDKNHQPYGYLLGQMHSAPIEPALEELLPILGQKIVEPLVTRLRDLKVSSITLIPTKQIGLLPLHAALYEDTFLGEEFIIKYAPSAQAVLHGQEALKDVSSKHAQRNVLAIGNPQPSSGAPLPNASIEAGDIAELFGSGSKSYIEEEADKAKVREALGEYTYVHFACHGYFNAVQPLASGLLLKDDKQLTMRELLDEYKLENTRLVALSACQTAIIDFTNLTEEAVGFPSTFMQAGVPGVIGTLWPVSDFSTALLMIRFYKNLLEEELHPAKALQQAQLWLRDVTAGEIKTYLKEFIPYYNRLTAVEADEFLSLRFSLLDEEETVFAPPYYWAGFTYNGV